MKLIFPLFTLMLILSGCASSKHIALPPESISQMKGARFLVTKRVPPKYEDITVSDGLALGAVGTMGGVVGGAIFGAMYDYGTQVINDAYVVDPAIQIKESLSQELVQRAQLQIVDHSNFDIQEGDVSDDFGLLATRSDYVLDVETIRWLNAYKPSNWNRHRVVYKVKCTLYNMSDQSTIAQATVFWQTPDDYDFPTHDELFAENARELKKQLNMASEFAVHYFTENVLPATEE